MKNKLLLLIAVCSMVVSCTKDGGGNAGNKKTYAEISNLDIVGASHIFTTGSGNTQRGRTRSDDQAKDHLFKVLTDGQTVEVIIKDKDGNVLPVEQMMVKPATDDLIFFAYSFNNAWLVDPSDDYWEAETVGGAYFARKSDGAVFKVPPMFKWAFSWSFPSNNGGYSAYEGIFKDKNQNLYCLVTDGGVYKIESNNGITATKIASGIPHSLDNPYKIDWYGNVLYFNDFGNVRCVTPSGKNFILDLSEISQTIEGEWEGGMGRGDMGQHFALMGLTPLIGSPDGGFLSRVTKYDESYNLLDEYVAFGCVNEQTEKYDVTRLDNFPEGEWITMSDRILVLGDASISNVKGPSDIETIQCNTPSNYGYDAVTDNQMYWTENNRIYCLDLDSGNSNMIYQLNPSWNYSNFSYTDNLVLFYAIDRPNEKTYMCEIRNGVYTQTEISEVNDVNSLPTVIDFIRLK